MKKTFTIISFLLLFTSIKAQITVDLEISKPLDSSLININKTTFTSNVLYDRTTSFANLKSFNQTNNNTSSVKHFEQAISELYIASKITKFNSVENIRAEYSLDKNTVEVGIINVKFHSLNYNKDDEQLGGLTFNKTSKKLTPVVNKPSFIEKEILIISPLKKNVIGETVIFKFKNSLLFNENNTKTLVSLTADFGNNQTHIIINNSNIILNNITINYTSDGKKDIVFVTTFSDGTIQTTNSTLYYRNILDNEPIQVDALEPFQDYGETSQTFGHLEYRVFYSNPNVETLLKPILFIDGFDPEDTRKIIDADIEPSENSDDHISIKELMVYGQNNTEIIPELNTLGYDVVIVNHNMHNGIDGGADYIERNAMAHIKLYQKLNEKLIDNGSSEQLVIIGPSMGGQISRYALAYMEKKHEDTGNDEWLHNTRLWVSLDSPHQGANIPLSMQANVYFFGYILGKQTGKDKYVKKLKSKAARQLLINQYPHGSSSLHNQYYNNLRDNGLENSNGYPMNLRKIAMVNGSISGSKNGNEGQNIMDIRGFTNISWWKHKSFQNQEWYIKNTGGHNEIFYGMQNKIFSRVRLSSSFTNNNSKGSIDVVPGGYYNTQGDIKDELIKELEDNDDIHDISIRAFQPNHTFIPTHSALDTNGFSNWYQSIDENLICTNQTPFDNYFGESHNSDHVSFTQKSRDWLFQELEADPVSGPFPSPTVYNDTVISIEGPDEICAAEDVTFTISNVPQNTSVIWEYPENRMYIINGQGTTSCTFRAFTRGETNITAMIYDNNCLFANVLYNKYITINSLGNPVNITANTDLGTLYYNPNFNNNNIQTFKLASPTNDNIDEDDIIYEHTILSIGSNDDYTSNDGFFSIIKRDSNPLIIETKATRSSDGSCINTVWGNKITHYFGALFYNNNNNWNLKEPYPNSSDISFKLDFKDKPSSTQFHIYLYDKYFNLKYSDISNNVEKTIDTYNLQNGIYYLHVYENGTLNKKQIIVNH